MGIAGLILDYTISDNHLIRKNEETRNQLYAFGNVGANFAQWRLRANYQYENKLAGEDGREQVTTIRLGPSLRF
ncbi:hypothetical protein AB6G21_10360 [Providencia hangzhouensis]|uniref:hypothetical protein n=1 Tax=Providencia hangzhouensis TaxID=3031799 RepID=UPI0034DD4C82